MGVTSRIKVMVGPSVAADGDLAGLLAGDTLDHFDSRVGLRTIESMTFPWSDETVSDALTLFERQ